MMNKWSVAGEAPDNVGRIRFWNAKRREFVMYGSRMPSHQPMQDHSVRKGQNRSHMHGDIFNFRLARGKSSHIAT